ncbi:MFS transporter [Candidatus Peregrinibacteria bacterium]|nr:MFS transporter [Candidatus Peregrinibacteria bacterium]
MPSPHDPYAALRSRNYRLYILGSIFDIVGNQMQAVAVGWELYERTRSAAILGFVGLAQFLPVVLLALPVGHAADTYNRRNLVLLAQCLTFLAAVGFAILSASRGPIALIFGCLALLGISQSINMTSRGSMLSSLVPREHLPNAATWNSNGRQLATMIGPGFGGLLIALTGGAFWVYVIDAMSSLAFIALLLQVRVPHQKRQAETFSLHSLLLGAKFIRRTKLVLATMTLDLFAVLLGGATTLLPIYALDILHVGPQGLGWLRAAPAVGSMAMAFTIAHLPILRKRTGMILLSSVTGFGIATILFGLSTSFWLSMLMLFLVGAFDAVSVVIRFTLMQLMTPNALLGRVSAVNSIFISSSNELGGFESGMVAHLLGAVPSVVLGGIGTIIVVFAVAGLWPEVRRLDSLEAPLLEPQYREKGVRCA